MSSGDRDWQKELQEASEAYSKCQKDIGRSIRARQQLDTQLAENSSVKEELALLEPTAKVFKQVGPVLVPQDLEESRANVQKRLEWITSEMKRIDNTIKDSQEKMEKKKESILKLQKDAVEAQTGGPTALRK